MNNPWKLATIGLALTGMTAMTTGVTTAWMMRPTPPVEAQTVADERPAVRAFSAAPAARPAAVRQATYQPAMAAPRVTRVATQTAAEDCGTGGERAMRIAKPGVVGALLGAGLGAAGGAIADGGKSAGKGAIIGGLAGAALGTGYGAYKTKDECGTIFGNGFASGNGLVGPAGGGYTQAMQPARSTGGGEQIQVYRAR